MFSKNCRRRARRVHELLEEEGVPAVDEELAEEPHEQARAAAR